ncbi:hypothetical protein AC59_1288 [Escherichia coli 3-373-03_S3_C3]|nr:hypothetical protein AC59_1288 [Escherichia coli 3-373-03_S3_C3]KDU12513.1 hypothetical protein AC34_1172 [Escherichia coli 3-373-03_S3_C2]
MMAVGPLRVQETVKRHPFIQQSNLRWTLQEGLLQIKEVSL